MKYVNFRSVPRRRCLAILGAFGMAVGVGTPAYAAIEPGAAVGLPVNVFDLIIQYETADSGFIGEPGEDIALDADGDGAVVWSAWHMAGTEEITGIYFRRLHADGSAGEIVTVNEVASPQTAVAVDVDGDAVVAWMEEGDITPSIWIQRIDKDGLPQGEAIQVSATAEQPAIAMDAAGNFVVAWLNRSANTVEFRRYDANGNPLGSSESVNGGDGAAPPEIAVSPKGDFIIAWAYGEGSSLAFVRRYTAAGTAIDVAPLKIADIPAFILDYRIALDADGNFAFAWVDEIYGTPDLNEVWIKRFGSDGSPLTADPLGTQLHEGDAAFPAKISGMAFGADGNPIVGWSTSMDSAESPIMEPITFSAARVKPDGTVENIDPAFDTTCDTAADTECVLPRGLAMDADGDSALSFLVYGTDDPTREVALRAQRFRGAEPADLAATLGISASEADAGDSVTLDLTVENLHPLGDHYGVEAMDSAVGATSGVTLDFTLPAALDIPVSIDDWTCTGEAESMSCVYAKLLSPAEEIVFETTFDVPADAPGEHTFGVSVSSDRTDPDAGNNASEVTLTVSEAPADDGSDDDNTPAPVGGGGGGALGWLVLLLAPLVRRFRAA